MRKGKYEIKETETEGRKATFWRHFTNISEHTAGLTVSVMKRGLSVRPITSDWCSWVADWWQAAKRRRRRSSACQLKEQFMCVCLCVRVYECVCVVQIRGTDSLQLGVRAVCVRARLCVCLMSDAVRYLNYANERSAENDWGISCWFCAVKVTRHAGLGSDTHTHAHTPSHKHMCLLPKSHKKKYTQVQTLTNITVRPEFGLLSASVPLKNQLSLPLIKPVSFTWTPPLQINCTAC